MSRLIEHERAVGEHVEMAAEGLRQMLGGEDLIGRPGRDDVGGDEHDQVRLRGRSDVMGRGDHGASTVTLLGDDLEDDALARHVESRDGLIEQQQVRVLHEPLCDQHTLSLPAGKFGQLALQQVADAESLDRSADALAGRRGRTSEQPELGVGPQTDGLGHRHRDLRSDRGALEHVGDPAVPRRHRIPEHAGGPARDLHEPRQHPEERGLP